MTKLGMTVSIFYYRSIFRGNCIEIFREKLAF
jgi:hypothetical protein